MKEFLRTISHEAGKISLDFRNRLDSIGVEKKTAKDLVTEADVAVEAFLIEEIKKQYPDHGIVGEETGTHQGQAYRWIIDPIDGTTSFLHKQPYYSVSIAVEKDGEVVLGAVNAPVLDEFFFAEKGRGATCNGSPIHVSPRDQLIDSVLGTGFACVRYGHERDNLPYFTALLPNIRDIRRYGSVAIDLSYIASARLDGFWELGLHIYDIAAGALILQEAGGRITDFQGEKTGLPEEMAASNGALHGDLTEKLQAVDRAGEIGC